MIRPLVKVCCISSLTEAKMALTAGADLLGLVSEMPSGPGIISLVDIAKIVKALPKKTRTVLLSSKRSCLDILHQHDLVKTWGIQLVDNIPLKELQQLRKTLPETHLLQVVHVQDGGAISQVLFLESLVDTILLDSGNPGAKIKTLGGTGQTHDWRINREICDQNATPVLLAGWLKPDNIIAAMRAVRPSGYDLCSGVRTEGKLDKQKLDLFMHLVHHEKEST